MFDALSGPMLQIRMSLKLHAADLAPRALAERSRGNLTYVNAPRAALGKE